MVSTGSCCIGGGGGGGAYALAGNSLSVIRCDVQISLYRVPMYLGETPRTHNHGGVYPAKGVKFTERLR